MRDVLLEIAEVKNFDDYEFNERVAIAVLESGVIYKLMAKKDTSVIPLLLMRLLEAQVSLELKQACCRSIIRVFSKQKSKMQEKEDGTIEIE